MWDDLRKQVTVERQQLHRLLATYRPLIERCAVSPPDDVELSALAAMLHSFYNGFENIFKRVAAEEAIPVKNTMASSNASEARATPGY